MQHGFVIIKPDATFNNQVGKIIAILEENGFEITRMEKKFLRDWQVLALYKEHIGKEFFIPHYQFMLSNKVVAISLTRSRHEDGRDINTVLAEVCGATDPMAADTDSIRARFGSQLPKNAIHFSDSPELATLEAQIVWAV